MPLVRIVCNHTKNEILWDCVDVMSVWNEIDETLAFPVFLARRMKAVHAGLKIKRWILHI